MEERTRSKRQKVTLLDEGRTNSRLETAMEKKRAQRDFDTFLKDLNEEYSYPEKLTVNNLGIRNASGDTALHTAIWKEEFEIARRLITIGGQVNTCGDMGDTALHVAVKKNLLELTVFLLAHGANPLVLNEFSFTPVMYAASRNQPEILDHLLFSDSVVDGMPSEIIKKLQENNQAAVSALLEKAILDRDFDMTKKLFWRGASPDTPNEEGRLPLHHAATIGNVEIVKFLYKTFGVTNTPDGLGLTPLMISELFGHSDLTTHIKNTFKKLIVRRNQRCPGPVGSKKSSDDLGVKN